MSRSRRPRLKDGVWNNARAKPCALPPHPDDARTCKGVIIAVDEDDDEVTVTYLDGDQQVFSFMDLEYNYDQKKRWFEVTIAG
jgi:hypothetical protein